MSECDEYVAHCQALEEENAKLRRMLSKSNADCIYCDLPVADILKCAHGFPGCGRADDITMEEKS